MVVVARDRDRRWADPRRPAVPRVRRRRRGARPHGRRLRRPAVQGRLHGERPLKRSRRVSRQRARALRRARRAPGGSSTRPRATSRSDFRPGRARAQARGRHRLPREHLQPGLVIIGGGFADAASSSGPARETLAVEGLPLREVVRIVLAELGPRGGDGGRRTHQVRDARRHIVRASPGNTLLLARDHAAPGSASSSPRLSSLASSECDLWLGAPLTHKRGSIA